MDTIGFVCEPDHPAFGPVAERLAARGFDVEFRRPADPISPGAVAGLSALVNGALHPEAFAALRFADRVGVPTWNGFAATTALSARLVSLDALSSVGCRVPEVRFDGPSEGYVAGRRYAWTGGSSLGEADFHVEDVRDGPVDHRYYAVDDGRETHMRALKVRTSLSGTDSVVTSTEVDIMLAARVRELQDRFGARAVAVDFTEGADGEFYALGATPVPSFAGAGMERRIADSVASLTTLGA
ncbi:hypothetical protein [Haloarcula nitratireducens]|uniref:ATP-grasp domain-containing protein n=1 Tax=Haloarcula nitratireducens TaxID=2487749 RepID=A0AAW4P6M6_9EURY|nr:hypothetical protein [Halomicroarcula nitratireducens]MBX0293514.1 hypothetical protein [Halomicroarcula nitratireducens]